MKKFFKHFSVAIIAIMLLCSSFVFAGCGGDPEFDDYFAFYTYPNGVETEVSSAPYLAPTDPGLHTERCIIKARKAVKIKRISGTITVTHEDAVANHSTEKVVTFDSNYDGPYFKFEKNYEANEKIRLRGVGSLYRISNLKIEFEPIDD